MKEPLLNHFSNPSPTLSAHDHLIVFTRYPEPGRTKTRLIPALGADGAAHVQRQMTEWTLSQAQRLLNNRLSQSSNHGTSSVSVDVRFAGGTPQLMQDWLGPTWTYLEQGEGDLGERLIRAFQTAFDQGAKTAIAVGIDCPGITTAVLAQAYETLAAHDGVIGPAEDGGYYLIGLRRPTPDLFKGIKWGTATVRAKTLAIATTLKMAIAQLEPLPDVDRPEDLIVWQYYSGQTPPQSPEQLSIVIPVLNEAEHINATIQAIQRSTNNLDTLDIIVVDGGSCDKTIEQAKQTGVRVIASTPGRANQMNAGAAIATGESILFLHADTQLPPDFRSHVDQTLNDPSTIAGAFELVVQGNFPGLRWIEWGVKWRSRLFQLPYGDQAIFLRTRTFRELGGFPRIPIMEDFELIQQLKQRGKVAIAPASVTTSGRRWQRLGVAQTTLVNQAIILGHALGISPQKLVHWYRNQT